MVFYVHCLCYNEIDGSFMIKLLTFNVTYECWSTVKNNYRIATTNTAVKEWRLKEREYKRDGKFYSLVKLTDGGAVISDQVSKLGALYSY